MKEEKRKNCKRNQSSIRKGSQYGVYLFKREGNLQVPTTETEPEKVTYMVGTFLKEENSEATKACLKEPSAIIANRKPQRMLR
jgi:hypothetical protein